MFVGSEKYGERKPQGLFIKHVIRKIFLEDWAMKLIALAITLGLWLGVTVFTKQGSARLTVPLSVRTSDNSILTNSAVKDVTIRVSGDDQRIRDLSPSDIRILLDLANVEPGEKIITITPQTVSHNLPSGVRLEDIQPRGVPVKLEAAEQKDVPVEANVDGTPAKGFEVYSQFTAPQRVRVRGPASYIQTLDVLPTEKIDVTGKSSDFVVNQVPVKVSNENMTLSDTVVDVTIHIGERRIQKSFPAAVSGSPTKKATVTLYGSPTILTGVKPENLKVEIQRNDAGQDVPSLMLPDALRDSVEVRSLKLRP